MGNDLTTIAKAADECTKSLETRLAAAELKLQNQAQELSAIRKTYVPKKGLAEILDPITASMKEAARSADDTAHLCERVAALERDLSEARADSKKQQAELRAQLAKTSEIVAEIATDLANSD